MKSNQLKELLKHIILEVNSQFEMIANKDVAPDVFGAVNVEENEDGEEEVSFKNGDRVKLKPQWAGREFGEIFTLSQWDGRRGWIGDEQGRGWYVRPSQIMHANEEGMQEGIFDGDVKKKAQEMFGKIKKITKISHPQSNSEYFSISLENPDSRHIIRKDKSGKISLGKEVDGKLTFNQVEEETGTGAVAGYSTPFAFKATGGSGERRRKKKKKHVKEKTLPDGRYVDDMDDGRRSNRISGLTEDENEEGNRPDVTKMRIGKPFEIMSEKLSDLEKLYADAVQNRKNHIDLSGHRFSVAYIKYIIELKKTSSEGPAPNKPELDEMTSSSAAGGQPGGTIQTPAWGTKNKLGSPRGIKGSEKLGYKVVRSITNEGSKI